MKRFVLLFCTILVASCSALEPTAPARGFNTDDLLIDVSSMPDGWVYLHKMKPDYEGTLDRTSIVFEVADSDCLLCLAWQDVHRFNKMSDARFAYKRMASGLSENAAAQWTYKSSYADETAFDCYYFQDSTTPHCEWYARYQEVMIGLHAVLAPGKMSYSDMEGVARAIDARVKSHMER